MNKQTVLWTALLVVVAGLVFGSLGYFLGSSAESESSNTVATSTSEVATPLNNVQPINVDWNTMLPQITSALKAANADLNPERPPSIQQIADLNGDGVPEALVSTGGGGASTGEVALMNFFNGAPGVVRIVNSDGTIRPAIFGIGASVGWGSIDFKVIPEGAYTLNYTPAHTGKESCAVTAYSWASGQLKEDKTLSLTTAAKACPEVAKQWQ
jgi:hypothetical protein